MQVSLVKELGWKRKKNPTQPHSIALQDELHHCNFGRVCRLVSDNSEM